MENEKDNSENKPSLSGIPKGIVESLTRNIKEAIRKDLNEEEKQLEGDVE